MPGSGIVIAASNVELIQKLKTILASAGITVIDSCKTGNEAIRRCRELLPDILLVHHRLSDITGFEVASIVSEFTQVIVLCDPQSKSYIDSSEDIFTVLLPVQSSVLLNTISLVGRMSGRIRNLKMRVEELEQGTNDQKIINRAKGILIDRYDLSESKAHKLIQKLSMDKRVKIVDAAILILKEEGKWEK